MQHSPGPMGTRGEVLETTDGNHAREECTIGHELVQCADADPHCMQHSSAEHEPCMEQNTMVEHVRDGMTMQEGIAYDSLKTFCANIMKKLAPPMLREVQASSLRLDAEPFTPKRTTRAAKRNASTSSVAKPKQAENVLLRALGLVPDDMVADESAVQELQKLFDSPLREQHVRVIAALFGKMVPPAEEMAGGGATAITVL